jgi:hypothetical protein
MLGMATKTGAARSPKTKKCVDCKKTKNITAFSKVGKNGHQKACRACMGERIRKGQKKSGNIGGLGNPKKLRAANTLVAGAEQFANVFPKSVFKRLRAKHVAKVVIDLSAATPKIQLFRTEITTLEVTDG